ncbi:MAG: endopeptidase La [Fretibacterium sp.]|nr:endopeptidase La [Fretibacterium sp.]
MELSEDELSRPVLPVRDVVLFPGVIAPLFVGRPRSLRALEYALLHDRELFVVAQRDSAPDEPEVEDLYEVGTLCNVLQMVRIPDGTTKVLVEGMARMRVLEYVRADGRREGEEALMASLESMPWLNSDSKDLEPWRRRVLEAFERYNTLQPRIPNEVMGSILELNDLEQLINLVGAHISVRLEMRQKLLEIQDMEAAFSFLLHLLLEEIDILELEHDIQNRVRSAVDKQQKDFYLREQLRVIQSELGEGGEDDELERYSREIDASAMSEEARERARRELNRLSRMSFVSPEASVVRTYLDWLLDLPWGVRTQDNLDISRAERILNRDHYGLKQVKDRILEFLSVRRLTEGKVRGQIICFVGPPGVGKTSLGRSIADSLDRKFVNLSLGGVRDEAEIRGHRRTYIGSLPGRIIQKLARAGSCNPVILMDELDKLGNDFRGDPASALLEVLDPQQNSHFADHYLEVPFDLSDVLFITTANVTHTIPKPLLDRMELIRLPGYLNDEKAQIARRHLFPRILKDHGLTREDLKITPAALRRIISSYTREAGVRGLDRALSTVARKVARKIVAEQDKGGSLELPVEVPISELSEYLGAPKLYDTLIPKDWQKGSVVGLAWTESGGDVLTIEAVIMKGKGGLLLTGNLGDVMQESAKAAVSFLRSESKELGLTEFEWDTTDIHVHVPEGAVPKDGPSAGVTMATAIFSAVGGASVRPGIAMTGELSLRGHVLPVGGIREKILAAKRYGLKRVILPKANEVDVKEVPEEYTKGMTFDYVADVFSVFRKVLSN